jgi:hypothetical protein
MSLESCTPDPTAALRQQRQPARRAAVTHEAVIEALCQLVLDTMFEACNALTVSVRDILEHSPEDRWSLDQRVKALPYRLRAEIGTAWMRLVGEAWLCVAEMQDHSRQDHPCDRETPRRDEPTTDPTSASARPRQHAWRKEEP